MKNRIILYILISVVIFGLAFLLQSNVMPSKGNDYAQCAGDAYENTLQRIDFGSSVNPTSKAEAEQYKDQYVTLLTGCSDLTAQWRMANVTERAFWAGTIGLIFLAITLYESASAAQMTKNALELTKSNSYKELRAYLGIKIDAVPVEGGMKNLAVATTIFNSGQTPAYDIRLIYSLYNAMPQWGAKVEDTTAILNPNEAFSPTLESKFENAAVVASQDVIFLNLHIVFTDMNSHERWLKFTFSKNGADWPRKVTKIPKRLNKDGRPPKVVEVIEGDTGMYLVKMETGDLKDDEPYKM